MINPDLTVGQLVTDLEKTLAGALAALTLVEKFDFIIPPQYRAPLEELQTVLSTVDAYLKKFLPAT